MCDLGITIHYSAGLSKWQKNKSVTVTFLICGTKVKEVVMKINNDTNSSDTSIITKETMKQT